MTGEPVDVEPTKRQWLGYWSMIVQQTQNAFNDKMAQFILIPLATSLAFGLTSATLIALFLVPAVYVILDDWGLAASRDPVEPAAAEGAAASA